MGTKKSKPNRRTSSKSSGGQSSGKGKSYHFGKITKVKFHLVFAGKFG
jgi:hypothetical protein